ncbi:FAD-dependent monooxygenase [Oceanomicrobium pacificus]|uniref:2-octaprenyl-6-methoxyphenyl hydroxylase n=1 Tax=Oceanomicrobium pacificus TaxID=2692916 RepID=A0A6B0TT20_9RHOB|nr:FAD-dependent monooxygenase [Oceanomicrobium pacificus]MXU64818.1 2-octaprenyl-6-methoxyphenyl hydroxylase [Oceanomicrobium pacificus]
MDRDSDILIVGGGLNGPVLALALAQAGLTSTVIDAQPAQVHRNADFDGRGYALSLTTVRMLTALGLWEAVADRAEPILDIVVSDGRAGEGASPWHLHFDHAEIEEGPMGHVLEDRYLRPVLLDALRAVPGITHLTDETVTAQATSPQTAEVTLASGRTLRGGLLVGCDGRRSGTAERAGIRRTGWGYAQTSLVCAIAHERPHGGAAHQFFMPSGPLAILPLPGNMSSLVWTETTERAAQIMALDDAGYMDELRPRIGAFLGEIALCGKRFAYPLDLTIANSLTGERLALAGDAAHGVHPLAGQGLNLGLRDVAALAEVLVDATRRGEDFGARDVLARYQRWRGVDVTALAVATDGINALFSNDNPLLRPLRDLGLAAVNAVPGLRRGLIREAAGLTGDLPRLLQGVPL